MVWKKTESKKKAKFIRKLKKKMDDGKAEGERREEEMKRIHEEERKKRREEMRVLEDTMRRELIMRQEHLTSFLLRLQGRKLVKRVTRYNLRYLVQPLTERSQTLPRTSKISPPTSGHSEIVSADGQIDSRRAPGGALSMPRTSTQPTPTLGHRWCPSPARSTAPGGVEDIRTRERGRRSGGRSSVGNVRCQ